MTTPFSTDDWLGDNLVSGYPLFAKRAKRFAIRLRRELAATDESVAVRLLGQSREGMEPEATLSVCKEGPEGRRPTLGVWIRMHDSASRRHFGIDFDYGLTHCHYLAGVLLHQHYWGYPRWIGRWTRARDAINGIKEWLVPELHIPGP